MASEAQNHDQDLLLARVLQEQERAFHDMLMAQIAPAHKTPTRERQQQQQQSSEEELSDEELARRLQEQEDEEAYAEGAEYEYDIGEEAEVDYDQLSYEDYNAIGDVAGAVSKGLPPHIIQQLPRIPAGQHMQQQSSKQHQQPQRKHDTAAAQADTATQANDCSGTSAGASSMCVVCQCDFEAPEELKVLPGCGHAYHADCIDTWLAGSKDCPICHKEVTLEAVTAAAGSTATAAATQAA